MGVTKIKTCAWEGRQAVLITNDELAAVVVTGGGHVVSLSSKTCGLQGVEDCNPLWKAPWTSTDPSVRRLAKETTGAEDVEGELLAGIGGWNLCAARAAHGRFTVAST